MKLATTWQITLIMIPNAPRGSRWGAFYSARGAFRRVGCISTNWNLCFSYKTVYKLINAISDCHTSSIKNQIIDVGYTSGKEQLDHLDH